jgi:competence ComEA-like helix-hairpin-helix protein
MKRRRLRLIGFVILILGLSGTVYVTAQTPGKTPTKDQDKAQTQAAGKTQPLKGKTVNINKATAAELVQNVPLITPELAKKIVKYREDNGDYQTLEELLQVEGFNRDLLRRIKPFLILEGIGGKDCTC